LHQTKIAKRYVNSLFASVTTKKDMTAIAKDMADLGATIANSAELQNFIKTPLLSKEQQKSGVEKLAKKAKYSPAVTNLLLVLTDNRRLAALPAIIRETENYMAKQSGTVPVAVATARKLTAADQKKIADGLKSAIGQDIAMQTYVDETLIGGVVIQVESTLIDGSLKTKLDKLQRDLTNKAA